MRSKTSCFNGALLRKDLCRFWPLWCAYLAIWLVAVPLNQFLTLFGISARYNTPIQLMDAAISNLLSMGTEMGLWMGLAFGCFFAMALFSYLCSARSVGMMHSFPIRREGLFFTHYLAGCIVFLSALEVTGLLAAAVQGAADALTALSGGTDALTRADLRQNLEDVAQRLTPYTAGDLLLTDDRAPVELLGIQVIDSLIQDEVSYYRDLYEREGLQGVVESLL